jgi:hypothetical protein
MLETYTVIARRGVRRQELCRLRFDARRHETAPRVDAKRHDIAKSAD